MFWKILVESIFYFLNFKKINKFYAEHKQWNKQLNTALTEQKNVNHLDKGGGLNTFDDDEFEI